MKRKTLVLIGIALVLSCVSLFPTVFQRISEIYQRPHHQNSHVAAPLSDCHYLSDIVEPITMVDGLHWDDDSFSLIFEDARSQRKYVCLYCDEWGDLQPYPDANRRSRLDQGKSDHYLVLGSASPHPKEGAMVQRGGREERAFLGLLERWVRDTPDAQEWNKLYDELQDGEPKALWMYYHEKLTNQQVASIMAIAIMSILEKRN